MLVVMQLLTRRLVVFYCPRCSLNLVDKLIVCYLLFTDDVEFYLFQKWCLLLAITPFLLAVTQSVICTSNQSVCYP